ncbi:MAG: DNA polymerase III subunit gamma/tau [Planctomycetota bacterium]|nr:DNA polymerase III subunit gamma/tau [Planctomycetota bacterium]
MNETTPTIESTEGNLSGGDGRYQVIARRYRPRKFAEVVGQEAVSEAIRQAILQQRLAHAYLFCGPRGVGKTSMARIFAAALQCPDAVDGNSCGQCSTCQRIHLGEDSDVTELDGASHRGIDDIRNLIEHVQYAPTQGQYRVFIIDEVHMLTREAFNSLLKTLEEPPAHVKFIFATTEPERVIPTVLSRCQRCDFCSISSSDIVRRLEQICQEEGVTAGEELLENIASLARGGMRDAQSLLDQVLSFAGDQPGAEDLDRITGRVSPQSLEQLLEAVDSGDLSQVIEVLTPIFGGGTEPSVLTEQIADQLRQRMHDGVAGDWSEKDLEANLLAQEILQETRQKLRRQDRGELVLELALMRMATLHCLVPLSVSAVAVSSAPEMKQSTVSTGGAEASSAGRAAIARKAVERSVQEASSATQQGSPAAENPAPSQVAPAVDEEPAAEVFEQLVQLVAGDSPMLARRIRAEGKLTPDGNEWQLHASEVLKLELAQDSAVKALDRWQRQHGTLVIMSAEASGPEEKPAETPSDQPDKPEIIHQAEEIFSSNARHRGPSSS